MLAGPAFIAVFSVSGVLLSVLSDKLSDAVSRVVLVGLGAATFSAGLTASLYHHCIITVSLLYHHCIITVSSLYHHQSLISVCPHGPGLLVLAAGHLEDRGIFCNEIEYPIFCS